MLKKVFEQFFHGISKSGLALIVVGTFVWSITMFKSGLNYSYGLGFWGPNGHDGVWHIALAQSLARGSWQMPIFSGENIKNYHIGFDLLLAALHRLTSISIPTLYFQVLPPLLAFFIGYFTFRLVFYWIKSGTSAFWATFFVYFGGSWGWVITYLRSQELAGESMFWSQQSISTLINPPFAFSLLLIFCGLWCLLRGIEKESRKLLVLAVLFFGVLVEVKVYGGILCLGALFIAGIREIVKEKKTTIFKIFIVATSVSAVLFYSTLKDANNLLVFKPFWYLETMMSFGDRVGWLKFGQAMVNYVQAGNWIKGVLAYIVALAIFWFGNLGTRVFKEILFIRDIKNVRKLDFTSVFFYSAIAGGMILPLLFIQKGTAWNTIQFFYYSLMLSGVLAGISLGKLLEKQKNTLTRFLIGGLVIAFTVPTTIGTLGQYLPERPPSKISREELQALEFLSKAPDGIILTLPFNKAAADAAIANPPRPLYLYESTAYVSAFANKPVYLADEVNLEITGYDWRSRRQSSLDFISTFSKVEAQKFLKQNNITYVYWIKKGIGKVGRNQDVLEEIFDNSEAQILKVK